MNHYTSDREWMQMEEESPFDGKREEDGNNMKEAREAEEVEAFKETEEPEEDEEEGETEEVEEAEESEEPEESEESKESAVPEKGPGEKVSNFDPKKAEHEAAEARRREKWEAERQKKLEAIKKQIERIENMTDEEAMMASIQRIGKDTEKLTRRNMKECVSEHIQTKCLENPDFVRLAMNPKKNMVNCFRYINRKAKDFMKQEMEDNDIRPESGLYGSDVPDGLCYQWAEDYFRDLDAKEDEEKEEKFIPRPYIGKSGSKGKPTKAADKKANSKQQGKKDAKSNVPDGGQLSLFTMDYGISEEKAG